MAGRSVTLVDSRLYDEHSMMIGAYNYINQLILKMKKDKARPTQDHRHDTRKKVGRRCFLDELGSDVAIRRRYVLYFRKKAFLHLPGGALIDFMSHAFQVNILSDKPTSHLLSARLTNTKDGKTVDFVGKVSFKIDLTNYWKFLNTLQRLFSSNKRDVRFVAYVLQTARSSLVSTAASLTSDEILSCDGMYEFSVFTNLKERLSDVSVTILSFRILSVSLVTE